jgi:hypothetical protein
MQRRSQRGVSPKRLLVLLLLVLVIAYVGYLAIVLGPNMRNLDLAAFARGYERILVPAELRGPVLRTAQGGADRVYLLTTQSERIIPLRTGFRRPAARLRQMLHVDLWAVDAATAQPAWRRRVRTFEDRGALTYAMLGVDGGTLWLFVREPIGIALRDGAIVADGARIEAANPSLAGKRVDQDGYVAFGGQGLQLTLTDATQWVVHGGSLAAEPRDEAPRDRAGLAVPAYDASYAHQLQMRGLRVGKTMWLGVLTDDEAKTLQADPVVPGRAPGERRGVMADFLAGQHVPQPLTVQPKSYRLWSAKVTQVSAAPAGWSKDLPDNWGTRDQFGDYRALPEAPPFLQAGLLGDGRSEHPVWFREPDSVVVLHHDKLGDTGRLRLARVSGPAGRVVWDAALGLADLGASMYGPQTLVLAGTEPNAAHDPQSEVSRETHEKLVVIDVPSGRVALWNLTTDSLREDVPSGGS